MSDSPFAEFAAGAAIVREGEAARAMYIIESGRVEIRSSRFPQPLAELGPGQVLGEMALLQEQPHSATATATTAVRALCIDQAAFFAVLRENPEVAVQLMRQLVLRLRAAEQRGMGAAAPAPGAPAASRSAPAPAPAAPAPAAPAAPPTPAAAPPGAREPAAAAKAVPAPASRPTPAPAKPAPDTPAATTPAARSAVDTTPVPAAAMATPVPPSAAPAPPAAPPPAPAAAPAPAPAPAEPVAASPAADWAIRHAEGEIRMAPQREEWLVGRPDPATGQVPEIDLGALDVARSLSRRHARLRREGAQLVLREEPGVANGTWVNGERLAAGTAVALKPGDRLRFGAVEVQFVAR